MAKRIDKRQPPTHTHWIIISEPPCDHCETWYGPHTHQVGDNKYGPAIYHPIITDPEKYLGIKLSPSDP